MRRITLLLLILALAQDAAAQSTEELRAGLLTTGSAVRRLQERDIQSMLDAQRERNDQLVLEKQDLESQLEEVQARIRHFEQRNKELRDALARHSSYEIQDVSVRKLRLTDRTIAVELGTDELGRVAADLLLDDREVESFTPPREPSKTHTISFHRHVLPERSYRIEVRPLDRAGNPLPPGSFTMLREHLDSLSFTTPKQVDPPLVSFVTPKDGDWESDRILVRYRVSKESYVEVDCEHLLPGLQPGSVVPRTCEGKGRYAPAQGVTPHDGDILAKPGQENVLLFDNLRPDTDYRFEIHAYETQFGVASLPSEDIFPYRTAPPRPPFGFAGPFQLTLKPEGLEALWNATEKPASASLELVLGPSTTFQEDGAEIDGNTVKITIPQDRLVTLIRKEGDRKTLPRVRVEMRSLRSESARMDLQVGIDLPGDGKELSRKVRRYVDELSRAAEDAPDSNGDRSITFSDFAISLLTLLATI